MWNGFVGALINMALKTRLGVILAVTSLSLERNEDDLARTFKCKPVIAFVPARY